MATNTVTLEPRNIPASARSLKAEFARAHVSGVETTARRGAVHVKMPIALLSAYRVGYDRQQVYWRAPKKEIVVEAKGFAVEQHTDEKAFHLIFKKAAEPEPETFKKSSPVRKAFFQRSLRAIEELQELDEKSLTEAVQAPTDYSVLVSALKSEEALASMRSRDPLAGARIRGLEAKRKLMEAEGGALSSAQVAKLLRITRQAVDKRRKEGKLLAVELGRKGFRFPAWQFGLSDMEPVLKALKRRDGWEQVTFFLNPSPWLGDRTPLEILEQDKCDIGDILRAASAYGEHGA